MWYEQVSEDNAKQCANNWKRFDSFGIRDAHEYEGWYIFYTSNRDSGLLDRSNEEQINQALKDFDEDQVKSFGASHWAVGYCDGYAVKVYEDKETLTPVFKELCRLAAALNDYPVLNECHYSDMQYNATITNIENEGRSLFENEPEEWAGQVYMYLSENEEIEDNDDQGGWVDKDVIKDALIALGFIDQLTEE